MPVTPQLTETPQVWVSKGKWVMSVIQLTVRMLGGLHSSLPADESLRGMVSSSMADRSFTLTQTGVIMMKNFNIIGAIPMITMSESAANWRNTHTHEDRTHSLTHFHQHRYNNHVVRSASSAIIFQCMLGLFVFP